MKKSRIKKKKGGNTKNAKRNPNFNTHQLSRTIPDEIKQQIRQNSKFGCVVPNCREAFYEYEHIIPEFKDAKEHNPDKMCLVCPTHNPRRTGKKGQENFSKEDIAGFYTVIRSSESVPEARSESFFYGLKRNPTIIIGNSSFINIESIISIDGRNVFSFITNNFEDPLSPQVTFFGFFQDSLGNELLRIENNQWFSPSTHWDVITTNGEVKIWDSSQKLVFHARKLPKMNSIEIVELNMWAAPFHIKIIDGNLSAGRLSKDGREYVYLSVSADYAWGKCGLYLNSNDYFQRPVISDIEMKGGKGTTMVGSGIWFGKGAGRMQLRNVKLYSSSNIKSAPNPLKPKKTILPPSDANYFVKGILTTKILPFYMWEEKVFELNGQSLDYEPMSWGQINEEGENLYYISRDEPADLATNVGFVGFYANDLLKYEWADRVFEAEVEEFDSEGNSLTIRVKRANINGRKVLSEVNSETQEYYHPHQFGCISPWINTTALP